jgi:ribosomal protein L37AE/L43A
MPIGAKVTTMKKKVATMTKVRMNCPKCGVLGDVTIEERGHYEYWHCLMCHITTMFKVK